MENNINHSKEVFTENFLPGETFNGERKIMPVVDLNGLIRFLRNSEIGNNLLEKFGEGKLVFNRAGKKLRKTDEIFINKIVKIVEEHLTDENFSIQKLGSEIGLSRSQIYKKIYSSTGKSPSIYVRTIRLLKAKEMIKNGEGYISEIAYQVGFSSPAYFSKCFKEEYGCSPNSLNNRDK